MMALKVTNTSSSAVTVAGISIAVNAFRIFPADRCVWEYAHRNDGGGYDVLLATFFPGNAAGVTLHSSDVLIEFGYIGKTGRFVATAR